MGITVEFATNKQLVGESKYEHSEQKKQDLARVNNRLPYRRICCFSKLRQRGKQ
jgi:hypothetical protein